MHSMFQVEKKLSTLNTERLGGPGAEANICYSNIIIVILHPTNDSTDGD